MGHIHLGRLPQTKPWKAVVAALDGLDTDDEVIALSARAAERDLAKAAYDPAFVETIRLLVMFPQAARDHAFGERLRDLGVPVAGEPDLPTLLAAVGEHLDSYAAATKRTDFGELAARALIGTLTVGIGDTLPGLFGADAEDVRLAASRMAPPRAFAGIARSFFARLMSDTLASWLDRTLATRIGPDLRFADVGERTGFDTTLAEYCFETTRIIREFSAGWLAKTLARDGVVDTASARVFGAVAFKKIGEELRVRRGEHA